MDLIFRFTRWFLPPHLSTDEQRIRNFLVLFELVLLPVLVIFGLYKISKDGMTLEVWLILGTALLSLTTTILLRYFNNLKVYHYCAAAYIIFFLMYEVAIGAGNGAAYLWCYMIPLAAFFIFGKWEGLWWNIGAWFALIALTVFNLGMYHYELAVGIRFMASYTLVCLVSYGLESDRHRHYTALAAEKRALEETLQQIRTLHRLMPICAFCKRIRDDDGYWHQVESYVSRYTEVQFSHSICPTCREQLYPRSEIIKQIHNIG